jgi:hypothetical protein
MGKFTDITSKKFNKLTVISRAENRGIHPAWLCKCECGNLVEVTATNLKTGNTKSCGCHKVELSTIHGKHGHPLYKAWQGMHQRCKNKTNREFHLYGGRGISVCERWDSFANFLNDVGERPSGMSLDRIDTNGNYEPDNCRWASWTQQNRNRRNNRFLSARNLTLTVVEWAEMTGTKYATIMNRLKSGWTDEQAIFGKSDYAIKESEAK